ncbi:transglycosylase domain-containing protein [uncultured Ruminococcus sp.]|uniref:transglycosylase domain-containing protein n=1 Tax=uncultured Ruminococcus sp. TaxID=165186 RepID=UPI00292CAC2E|nr:transglycosylase domain-containing protein [uncultured Ruminococcus sp.]
MRNKRETDISSYMGKTPEQQPEITYKRSESGAKRFFKGLGKFLLTIFSVLAVAGIVTAISLAIYIIALASEPTGIDLKAKSLNQTSRIFIKDSDTGEFTETRKLYSTENRIWVDNQNIPDYMKEAQVAIEDKRFYEHNGVDWQRTLSAVAMLATGSDSYGGSTITQQLIKNITDDNEVSINRKLREICKALKLEQEYTKDQILEAYLNVVNYGNNCQGVEAAAQLYFGKSIKDCSLAECAAIAGITQNPSRWNPLIYPENNRERRELILSEMYDQGVIKTKKEYDEAMSESAKMTFVGFKSASEDEDDEDNDVQNWYYDQLFYDLRDDLARYYNISPDAASEKIYTEGLKIYCAMDEKMQNYIEKEAMNIDKSADPSIELGSVLMDFDGRVIATVGSSNRKTTDLAWDRAAHSALQPGSSIKPLFVYPIAIENKQLYFSSTVLDEPIEKYEYDEASGGYISGPKNAYGSYLGNILLPDAIERSSNAVAVQVMELIGGPSVAYEQAITKMNFKHLTELDGVNTGALSIGGLNGGVTVREMASAYTYMGNEGLYYKPYTYYYITDSEDNIILDNRDAVPKQAYSAETAGIMNRLLHYNVENSQNTYAMYARVSGWDIVGKTGTTDSDRDCWFCGMSPYAVMATWTGFDSPQTISDKTRSAKFFANVMGEYLKDKEQKEYKISKNLIPATYNPVTGLVISTDSVSGKYVGYYTEDNMPAFGSAWYDDSTYDWNAYSGGGGESSGSGGESSGSGGGSSSSGGESSQSSGGGGGGQSSAESSEGPVVPPEQGGGGGGGGGQSSADAVIE